MSLTYRLFRWAGAATIVLTLVGGGLVIAGPAHAEPFPFTTDGFEGVTTNRWVLGQVPGLSSAQIVRDKRARTGTNNIAILNAFPRNPAFASVFRLVTPDDVTPRPGRTCTPYVFVRRVANNGERDPYVNVLLQVRHGGPTGRIISTRVWSPTSTTTWVSVNFNPIPWQVDPFSIEISGFIGTVLVDDLSITCT